MLDVAVGMDGGYGGRGVGVGIEVEVEVWIEADGVVEVEIEARVKSSRVGLRAGEPCELVGRARKESGDFLTLTHSKLDCKWLTVPAVLCPPHVQRGDPLQLGATVLVTGALGLDDPDSDCQSARVPGHHPHSPIDRPDRHTSLTLRYLLEYLITYA